MDAPHPAEAHLRSVDQLRTRTKLAAGALYVTMALGLVEAISDARVASLVQSATDASGAERAGDAATVVNTLSNASTLLLIVTAVLFLRWLRQLVVLVRKLGGVGYAWSKTEATVAWFLPVVSLVRPYQVIRDAQKTLTDNPVAPPPLRIEREGAGDYRGTAFVEPPAATTPPRAPVLAWWLTYLFASVLISVVALQTHGLESNDALADSYRFLAAATMLDVLAAFLAAVVVRRISAQLEERFRRIRHATPEELTAQGIRIAA